MTRETGPTKVQHARLIYLFFRVQSTGKPPTHEPGHSSITDDPGNTTRVSARRISATVYNPRHAYLSILGSSSHSSGGDGEYHLRTKNFTPQNLVLEVRGKMILC